MAVYTGRLTRRQIIDQALKKVGNTTIVQEARVELARLLEALYRDHEWPFLYTETTLTLSSSVSLPEDFLKVESPDTGLRVTAIDGVTEDRPILIVEPQQWRRIALPRAATAEAPEIAMVDYATSVLKPWPIPESSVTALLVYKFLPAEVPIPDVDDEAAIATYDADVPTFPFHDYLLDKMEQWGHEYEHHAVAAGALAQKNAALFDKIRGNAIPADATRASSLELDPGLFQTPAWVHEE